MARVIRSVMFERNTNSQDNNVSANFVPGNNLNKRLEDLNKKVEAFQDQLQTVVQYTEELLEVVSDLRSTNQDYEKLIKKFENFHYDKTLGSVENEMHEINLEITSAFSNLQKLIEKLQQNETIQMDVNVVDNDIKEDCKVIEVAELIEDLEVGNKILPISLEAAAHDKENMDVKQHQKTAGSASGRGPLTDKNFFPISKWNKFEGVGEQF